MELTEIPIYVYPIVFVLLVIVVAAISLLFGKRKYNKENGIVKEKKVKTPREKTGKKLKRAESAASAASAASFKDEFDTDDEYENAVESLKSEPAAKPKQNDVTGPVIVVDEKKVNEEEIIEWKPPTEEKKIISEPEPVVDTTNEFATPVAAAAVSAAIIPPAEPAETDWDDEDLELFEARTYSFDEETQSGIVTDKAAAVKEEKPAEVPPESIYAFREKKEPSRDPADDEGVQIFETKDEKPMPVPKNDQKVNNSKYAYFDAVMEKEKMGAKKETEWQPPEQRTAPIAPTASDTAPSKPKKSMQYIELDLDDKE